MIYKYPIFDVSSPKGFLTSQQMRYSEIYSLKFSDKLEIFRQKCPVGERSPPLPPYIYATECCVSAKLANLSIRTHLRTYGNFSHDRRKLFSTSP